MNIVHISPNSPYNDGWGFQENLLPKYHSKLGHKVTLIVTDTTHMNGMIEHTEAESFTSVDGFTVIRLPYKKFFLGKFTNIFYKLDVYEKLVSLEPDFIFYHGLVSTTIFDVIRYKKRREKVGKICTLIQDNHLDYNIGNNPKTLKDKALRAYYRVLNRISQKSVQRVYGVTPWRKQYAEEYYRISSSKTDVLIMGADDEKINFDNKEQIRTEIRKKYDISDNDFLVVTGGKIDERKKIHTLMEACGDVSGVKLLIFGSVSSQMKERFEQLSERFSNIISIGWLDADKVYDYFFAADLVCFPGQHSVLWEQACASKVPCLFARWPGMEHVDNGGNSDFVDEITPQVLKDRISELVFTEKYNRMKTTAQSQATDIYLYSKVAEKSLKV